MNLKERLKKDIIATKNARISEYKKARFCIKLLKLTIFLSFIIAFYTMLTIKYNSNNIDPLLQYIMFFNGLALLLSFIGVDSEKHNQNIVDLNRLQFKIDIAKNEDDLAKINEAFILILNSGQNNWLDTNLFKRV